jgi:hypothetical protein
VRPLVERGWWDFGAIWLAALPSLLGVALLLWRGGHWRAFALALGWFALAIAPSTLALPYVYNFLSMRLLYFPGPGAAVLWGAACAVLASRRQRPSSRALTATGLGLLLLIPNVVFVLEEVALHDFTLRPVWQLARIARQYPDERHLVLNPLDWVAYVRQWYPVGHEGVSVMPIYVTPGQLATVNSGLQADMGFARVPAVQTALRRYYYDINGGGRVWDEAALAAEVSAYDRIWLETFSDEAIVLQEVGSVDVGGAHAPEQYMASFEGQVYLTHGAHYLDGRETVVTLDWQYLGQALDATIFRHVFDCAGNVLGLGDGHLLGRTLPFTHLVPGAEVHDVRRIALEALSPDGCYLLEVGLFRPDGSRVTAWSSGGIKLENGVVPIH